MILSSSLPIPLILQMRSTAHRCLSACALAALFAATGAALSTHAQSFFAHASARCPAASVICRETPPPPAPFRHPSVRDRWWAADKAKHVGASFLLTLSSQYVLTEKKGLSEGAALPLSVGLSAAAGLAKELYDRRTAPAYRFSRRDLAADGVGILLAVGLILL